MGAGMLQLYRKAGADTTHEARGEELKERQGEDGDATLTGAVRKVYEGTVEF